MSLALPTLRPIADLPSRRTTRRLALATVLWIALAATSEARASAPPAVGPAAPPLVGPAVGPAAAPLLGPPLVCHAFDIGSARSLPWGAGSFGVAPDYDLAQLPQDSYDLLAGTDDAFVHMETLRRAVVYVTGLGEGRAPIAPEQRETLIASLLHELQFDAEAHQAEVGAAREAASRASEGAGSAAPTPGVRYFIEPEPATPAGGRVCQAQARDAALCWLDYGYLLAALRQAGAPRHEDGVEALRAALLLRPGDARLRLGLALGLFGDADAAARAEAWKQLDAVVQRAENAAAGEEAQADALRRNLIATVGPLLSTEDHDELVEAIRARAGKG